MDVKWCLIVISICINLIVNDAKHYFVCFWSLVYLFWRNTRYTHLNAEFQRIARRDKKAFLGHQCKGIEKTIEQERVEISSRKLEIPREHFKQRWAQ